jgi:L-amino acid N-acyltransferase YncA
MTRDRRRPASSGASLRRMEEPVAQPRQWTVEDHLRGKPAESVDLYHRFVALVQQCGPFGYVVAKTTITFKGSRRGFAGARPDARGLVGYLDLQRPLSDDPRISSASPYTARLFVNHFRVVSAEQLDEQFAGWVRDAYQVGQGAHLTSGAGPGTERPGPGQAWSVLIREATAEDWPRIYPFFSAIVANGRSYAFPDRLTLDQARAWWIEKPPGRTVVAVEHDAGHPGAGRILGSAKMGPNRPGRGAHIGTASFMVDPAHAGRGIGRALGEHVIAWGRAEGYHGLQFNAVVETNQAAVRLWQALGFRILATVPEAFDHAEHGLVGLHLMYLRLADPI